MNNNREKEILQDSEENTNNDIENESKEKDQQTSDQAPEEIGGPKGPEPTRYGDWEINGRCYDF